MAKRQSTSSAKPSRRRQVEAESLRLALPSKGELEEPCLRFLADCGMTVDRPSLRGYTGTIPALPFTAVLFQRAADIPDKVEEGSADLGIAGLDTVYESSREDGEALVIMEDLGFGRCQLVVAVPDPWIDVSSISDLVDLSLEMRERGRVLRVATRYPRLAQRFFLARGLSNLRLMEVSGALEAAPTMGYADIVADLTATGATLRDNHLKPLVDGVILTSQACLIGNRSRLRASPAKLESTRRLLEFIEARMLAAEFCTLTARVKGTAAPDVMKGRAKRLGLAGLRISTLTPALDVASAEERWWTLTGVIPSSQLLEVTGELRKLGGTEIAVSAPGYLFREKSRFYQRLKDALDKGGAPSR